jgi:hypothetical protein
LLFEESVLATGGGDTEAEDQLKILPPCWWWNKGGPEARVVWRLTGSLSGFPPAAVAAMMAALWLAASSDSAVGAFRNIWLWLRRGATPSGAPWCRPADSAAAAAVATARLLLFMSGETGLLLLRVAPLSLLLPPRSELVTFISPGLPLYWWATTTGPPANQGMIYVIRHEDRMQDRRTPLLRLWAPLRFRQRQNVSDVYPTLNTYRRHGGKSPYVLNLDSW